jgi:hypothetical protein
VGGAVFHFDIEGMRDLLLARLRTLD